MQYNAFDFLPSGVAVIDAETGRILYANQALLNLLKIESLAENTTWFPFVKEGVIEDIRQSAWEQLAFNGNFRIELQVSPSEDLSLWVVAEGNVDKNKPVIIVSVSEITELKQLQYELDLKSKHLEMINETVPGGILIMEYDPFLTITYANNGFYEMLGYTKEEFAHKFKNRCVDLMHSDDLLPTMDSLERQTQTSNKFDLQFRIRKKDGELIWVSCSGISMYSPDEPGRLNCIILDIDKNVKLLDKLNKEQELSRTIFDLSDDIIFDYDIINSTVSLSANISAKYKAPAFLTDCPQAIVDSGIIHEDDVELFLQIVEAMKLGISNFKGEIRVKLSPEQINWFSIDYKLIFDNELFPVKSLGKITDVTAQRGLIEDLQIKAKTDPLTKIFNKEATNELIRKSLAQNANEKAAFLIIDIDNFKGVNDNLGHQFGDSVLKIIADNIKHEFRENDIVGRIGGDEFVVFIKKIPSIDIITQKALALTNAFRRTYSGEKNNYKISGSIGIAIYPQDGTSFEELFKNADLALYESKKRGKDCYSFYDQSLSNKDSTDTNLMLYDERQIANFFKDDLIYNIFEMLYETQDLYTTINMVLEIVGKQFDVDRCYIFEKSENGLVYSNTFEWCNQGTNSLIDNLQNLPESLFQGLFAQYSTEGIFFSNRAEDLQSIELYDRFPKENLQSILHCALLNNGKVTGFIGYHDCKNQRIWTIEEISTLSYIAKILSIFLVKKNMFQELIASFKNMKTMLDSMKSYIYVIDENTHETLYVNKELAKLFREDFLGNKCHLVAFGRNEPCKNCPKISLAGGVTSHTAETYNPFLKIWSMTTASRITWTGGVPAILISCIDITPFKNKEEGNTVI